MNQHEINSLLERKRMLSTPSIPCELCTSNIISGHMYRFNVSVSTVMLCSDCYGLVRDAERVEVKDGEIVR